MFTLDSRLKNDTRQITRFELCDVLLMNDSNYPWVILVPRINDTAEIYELSETEQYQLTKESSFVSAVLQKHFQADKMNVAALGNMVRQLHIHHVARFTSDAAWPGPVWGAAERVEYSTVALEKRIEELAELFADMQK